MRLPNLPHLLTQHLFRSLLNSRASLNNLIMGAKAVVSANRDMKLTIKGATVILYVLPVISSQISGKMFRQYHGQKLLNSTATEYNTTSPTECGSLCLNDMDCLSFNWIENGNGASLCQLNHNSLASSVVGENAHSTYYGE